NFCLCFRARRPDADAKQLRFHSVVDSGRGRCNNGFSGDHNRGPKNGHGSQLRYRAANRSPWLPLTLPIAGVVMLGLMRGKVGRKVSKRSAIALLCFSLALLGFMLACGGSSSTPVGVSVTPATASLWPNDSADGWPSSTQAFTATVSNTTNTAVTWSISPSTGAGS